MKKLIILLLCAVLLVALCGCNASQEPEPELTAVSSGVSLRSGMTSEDSVICGADMIRGYTLEKNPQVSSVALTLYLTEEGRTAVARATEKLRGGDISLWSGKTLISSASVLGTVDNDSVIITMSDMNDAQLDSVRRLLAGVQPTTHNYTVK